MTALVSLITCAGIGIVLAVFNPGLALAVSVVLVPLVVIGRAVQPGLDPLLPDAPGSRISILYADMQESLSGILVSQAYNQQPANEARFARLAQSYCQARERSMELQARFFPFIDLLSTLAKAIALGVGASRFARRHPERRCAGRVPALPRPVLRAHAAALDGLRPVAAGQGRRRRSCVSCCRRRRPPRRPSTRSTPSRLRGEIGLDHVTFAYESTGLVAMNDVSLTIPPGQVVALVGTTGAGKSTLMKLVARFYDATSGTVRVDGIPICATWTCRPTAISSVSSPRSRSCSPGPSAPTSPTAARKPPIWRSSGRPVRSARTTFIASLPQGYHTPVSEQGQSLSAGERQLLSLARALLVDPAILLLDEATANLDLATEARVQRAMGLVAQRPYDAS